MADFIASHLSGNREFPSSSEHLLAVVALFALTVKSLVVINLAAGGRGDFAVGRQKRDRDWGNLNSETPATAWALHIHRLAKISVASAVCLMPDDVELRQEILQKTLEEVAQENKNHRNEDAEEEAAANPCVICLDAIAEPGISIPCGHVNFDFLCLLSWLEQRPSCPLCMISSTQRTEDTGSNSAQARRMLSP